MIERLREQARRYSARGWVVLPVIDKVPQVQKWTQLTVANDEMIDSYFSTSSRANGVGILCGVRSAGLLVLDVDSVDLIARFEAELPELAKTYRVQTPSGCAHFYYQATGYAIEQRFDGIDLQYTGRQVVAPPSVGYTLINDVPLQSLDTIQFNMLYSWCVGVTRNEATTLVSTKSVELPVNTSHYGALITRYRKELGERLSRNQALFYTSLYARDRGMTAKDVVFALVAEFAGTPSLRKHRSQSVQARLREARATIDSAFSRKGSLERSKPTSLTDAMRQAFAQRKQVFVWRCLDALYETYAPGTELTRSQAIESVSNVLSHNFVVKALECGVFAKKVPPTPPTKNATRLPDTSGNEKNECYASRGEKQVKIHHGSKRGRKAFVYVVPSLDDVAQYLGMTFTTPRYSTTMTKRLESSKEARKALLESKIRHNPGKYANSFLSSLLGVTTKTLKKYERELGITRIAQTDDVPVGVWNLNDLPWVTEKLMGYWLQDDNGKRYPAYQDIAVKLLGRGRRLWLRRQTASMITYSEPVQKRLLPSEPNETPKLYFAGASATGYTKLNRAIAHTKQEYPQSTPSHETALDRLKTKWKQASTVDRADLLLNAIEEQYAPQMPAGTGLSPRIDVKTAKMLLHQTPRHIIAYYQLGDANGVHPNAHIAKIIKRARVVNNTPDEIDGIRNLLSIDGRHTLSRQKAYSLVAEYGLHKVRNTAQFVSQRDGIKNKTGYLIECLRSEQRIKKIKASLERMMQ